MKSHYDFSKGERAKFYRPDAVFRVPVYLDEKVQSYLVAKAEAEGVELSDLVNQMLRREIGCIETVGQISAAPFHCFIPQRPLGADAAPRTTLFDDRQFYPRGAYRDFLAEALAARGGAACLSAAGVILEPGPLPDSSG